MAAAPAMAPGTGPPARLPAPLPPAAAPAFRGAAALPPQLPAAAAPGAEGGAGAAAALAELLPDTADWETQQLGVTNLMIELQVGAPLSSQQAGQGTHQLCVCIHASISCSYWQVMCWKASPQAVSR
jgi:hypothetical protein